MLTSLWLAGGAATARADEINLYSTREAPLMEPAIASRTAATGIKIAICVTKLKLFVVENVGVMHESTYPQHRTITNSASPGWVAGRTSLRYGPGNPR